MSNKLNGIGANLRPDTPGWAEGPTLAGVALARMALAGMALAGVASGLRCVSTELSVSDVVVSIDTTELRSEDSIGMRGGGLSLPVLGRLFKTTWFMKKG